MASNEDLLRDLEEQERRDDARYRPFNLAGRELSKVKPVAKPNKDNRSPLQRFEEDIAPVIERRRRVAAGLPISSNPFWNAWLKLTGQDKIPVVDVVEPDAQFRTVGPTLEEITKQIAENPDAFRHLRKTGEKKTQATGATRKTAEDLILQSKLRGPIKDDEEEQT